MVDQASGDFPTDDEYSGSGSGESDDEDVFSWSEPEVTPNAHWVTSSPSLTASTSQELLTQSPSDENNNDGGFRAEEVTDPPLFVAEPSREPRDRSMTHTEDMHNVVSESLFQRTEVLAAVIAGGIIGFLFALFLILLLVYRMRKKDEGSYDLGERKPPISAYQKAPTKEFYA